MRARKSAPSTLSPLISEFMVISASETISPSSTAASWLNWRTPALIMSTLTRVTGLKLPRITITGLR